jgi:hypothetical protein
MKKFARGFASLLLKLSLFNLALAGAFLLVFGTPDVLKKSLADSKLYDTVVANVIDSSKQASSEEGFPIQQPEVQDAIKSAFPSETIKSYSEQFIDSLYHWLYGAEQQPAFRIDLTPAKQKLAEGVGDYAMRRYTGLPVCTVAQLRSLGTDIDPFNVPCQVPGVSAAAARQDVIATISGSDQFLSDPVLTASNLPKDSQGKTVFDNLAPLRQVAKITRALPWILGICSLLLALFLVLLHDKKREAVRSISATLAGTGLFVLVSTLLVAYVFAQVNKPGGVLNRSIPGSFQESMLSISSSLSGALNRYLVIFSLVYIVVGGVALLYIHFTDKRIKPSEDAIAEGPAAPETTTPEAEKPEDKK